MFNNLWLEYEKSEWNTDAERRVAETLQTIRLTNISEKHPITGSILEELKLAFGTMFGMEPKVQVLPPDSVQKDKEESTPHLHLSIVEEKSFVNAQGKEEAALGEEGYYIYGNDAGFGVQASGYKGLLYGVFAFLAHLRQGKCTEVFCTVKRPSNPLRMLNHWDNMDGSIERGYSGESFFFEKNEVVVNARTKMYARAVASVGINAVVINNVNVKDAATYLISNRYYARVRELSELFAQYGISLFLSVNYAMPLECPANSDMLKAAEQDILDTADPLDVRVREWWRVKCNEVYENVPLLGGFLVKADSEGRPGPFTYGRTQADGANMLAEAIAPHGGLIIWRCFVYNCQQDWRDRKTDRARAGYDYFKNLDGQFAENVILQIKNGPMDFQVREPVSPLFGGLKATNQMLEVQIAQEYTGQQIHVCYLIPWFQEILEFRTGLKSERADDKARETGTLSVTDAEKEAGASVAELVSGEALGQCNCGMAAVCNTGNDYNWTGHDLAGANLYGFGRLAFDTSLRAEEIAKEWIRLFYINQIGETGYVMKQGELVIETVCSILMRSWPTYEKYTSPLGIGWMVVPHYHYGPDVDGYEYSRWGTYHRADHEGIGVDRTMRGTGYTGQYNEPNFSMYDKVETTPEELLLFFHHMPYSYRLKTGKTILQHIYDTHFEGADEAEVLLKDWKKLAGVIDPAKYERALERLERQAAHAKEWRDVINSYFYRKTGIADEKGRELY